MPGSRDDYLSLADEIARKLINIVHSRGRLFGVLTEIQLQYEVIWIAFVLVTTSTSPSIVIYVYSSILAHNIPTLRLHSEGFSGCVLCLVPEAPGAGKLLACLSFCRVAIGPSARCLFIWYDYF
ncbi:hypothetical protein BV25DRAFT_1922838 [Artomyces pyxidatus]|uniref:Uncharacterized protein n=1 Tax=Artomyces pyxidatus TaxID=48021 RepID=A0ACB8SEA5_9AGAM|nr:hypothetical protein BV25DRAFT_1922838 [Artomyces pyxidatus]